MLNIPFHQTTHLLTIQQADCCLLDRSGFKPSFAAYFQFAFGPNWLLVSFFTCKVGQYYLPHRIKYKMPPPMTGTEPPFCLVALLSSKRWLLPLQPSCLHSSWQEGEKGAEGRALLLPFPGNCTHNFHVHPIGESSVAWPHLTGSRGSWEMLSLFLAFIHMPSWHLNVVFLRKKRSIVGWFPQEADWDQV